MNANAPKAILLASLLLCAACVHANEAAKPKHGVQPPFLRGIEKQKLEWLAAKSGLCALSIAGHPDDEDGATIAWLRRLAGVEVHVCLATRGEGGQNESGPELGRDLALLRTHETKAAAEILGAEDVWYLEQPDFGYSKSAKETFSKGFWNHDEALARLVLVIRTIRPEILFTNHDPGGTDHGHHVATAQLIVEAFDAAGDRDRFPEQLTERIKPWQPQKLYRRVRGEDDAAHCVLDVGQREPLSGRSPAELAAWALSQHFSQGMWVDVRPGDKQERRFALVKCADQVKPAAGKVERSFCEGFPAFDDPKRREGEDLDKALADGGLDPMATATLALKAFKEANDRLAGMELAKEDEHQIARMQRRYRHSAAAAAEALGLRLQTRAADGIVTAGEATAVTVRLANSGPLPVGITRWFVEPENLMTWTVPAFEASEKPIAPGQFVESTIKVTAKRDALPTYPPARWLGLLSHPFAPLQLEAVAKVTLNGESLDLPLRKQKVPIELALPFDAQVSDDPVLVFDDPDRADDKMVQCRATVSVTNHRREPWNLYAKLEPDPATRQALKEKRIHRLFDETKHRLGFEREEQTLQTAVKFFAPVRAFRAGDLSAECLLYTETQRFAPSPEVRFRRVPLKLPAGLLRIGLVRTYDDATWAALKRIEEAFSEVLVEELTPESLRDVDLSMYHTIVLDLRAAQYRPDVRERRQRLMEYMRQGGNLICLYHKDFDWNRADEAARGRGVFRGGGGGGEIAPYPITLSFQRVTDEKAAVRLLKPDHPLLTRPCKIWDEDFSGWVQERGVYFPSAWDEKYTALLSSNDSGDPPLDGGLLVAEVDKGSFIYCSYVLYRQLRAGVPGAYRLFANLLCYPKTKAKE